jgi:condensin-2 complex subunit G2
MRITIEDNCLQDFIQDAVHTKNNTNLKAAQIILSHFSSKRIKYKHIDSVIVRLYEPILWRSLKNANPYVRRNAVTQFMSSFPLV